VAAPKFNSGGALALPPVERDGIALELGTALEVEGTTLMPAETPTIVT
jgi:hypothetical protein